MSCISAYHKVKRNELTKRNMWTDWTSLFTASTYTGDCHQTGSPLKGAVSPVQLTDWAGRCCEALDCFMMSIPPHHITNCCYTCPLAMQYIRSLKPLIYRLLKVNVLNLRRPFQPCATERSKAMRTNRATSAVSGWAVNKRTPCWRGASPSLVRFLFLMEGPWIFMQLWERTWLQLNPVERS